MKIKLELNKKSIAKLNDEQLTTVKGGNKFQGATEECNITCQSTGQTIVHTTR